MHRMHKIYQQVFGSYWLFALRQHQTTNAAVQKSRQGPYSLFSSWNFKSTGTKYLPNQWLSPVVVNGQITHNPWYPNNIIQRSSSWNAKSKYLAPENAKSYFTAELSETEIFAFLFGMKDTDYLTSLGSNGLLCGFLYCIHFLKKVINWSERNTMGCMCLGQIEF